MSPWHRCVISPVLYHQICTKLIEWTCLATVDNICRRIVHIVYRCSHPGLIMFRQCLLCVLTNDIYERLEASIASVHMAIFSNKYIHLSHCCHIFPWLCVWDGCTIIFCHLLQIYPGNTGTLFPLLMFSLWYLQMIGYIMACGSCSFVCRLHHLIIIIMQTYLKALNY